jgi:putative ABC transport system permease protein
VKLYRIVLKDIARRKKRVLFAALGVAIGTMTVVGVLTIALAGQAKIYNELEKYGANLAVTPSINNVDTHLGDLSMGTLAVGENYIPQETLPQIRQITDGEIRKARDITDQGDIATIAPELYINTEVKGSSVMVVGVEPDAESKIKTWWNVQEGNYLTGTDQALVGAVAAKLLTLNTGDTVDLNGSAVTVTGILGETGSNDDYQVFVPLETLQKAYGKEGLVSSVNIRALCNACPVEIIANAINQNITGVRAIAVKQVAEAEMGIMGRMNRFMWALGGITLVVGLFGVVNTMMSSVNERIKDIGIMRAAGASRNQIMRIFIYEAVIIGIVGGILGYLAGTLLAYIVGPLVFEGIDINFVLQYLPLSLGLAILVAALAAVYPALRATRIRVADAFRSL